MISRVAGLTFLHLAPHPDDESIGAVATLLALKAAGHRVINVACSLGRPADAERRRAELEAACALAGFELADTPPVGLSRHEDRAAAERELVAIVGELVAERAVDVVVSPSPHDGHYGHEAVGRAARDAVAQAAGPRLWLWGLWADLPWPTLYHGFDVVALDQALAVLSEHRGEIARNDYRQVLRGRATANRVLGSERVFGWGSAMRPQPYAELLMEVALRDGEWRTGAARELDPADPLADAPDGGWRAVPIAWWLYGASFFESTGRRVPPG
jgi:LmbE family N-acetylglucosaminyl deacetylase